MCDFQTSISSVTQSCPTLWPHGLQHSRLPTNSWSLLKLISIKSVMPSNYLILCYPLLLLPSVFPSIWVFSNESALHIRYPKCWSFSFSISSSNEYLGLISFRIDWFDLSVQRTLKSLLQDHSSKASFLQHSAFFMVQLSYPCMTTGKTIALTGQTFVCLVTLMIHISYIDSSNSTTNSLWLILEITSVSLSGSPFQKSIFFPLTIFLVKNKTETILCPLLWRNHNSTVKKKNQVT